MGKDILVITEHMDGKFSDVSFEMAGKAKELASASGGQAVVLVMGHNLMPDVFNSDKTIYVENAALAQFNPDIYGKTIEAIVRETSPMAVLFGWTAAGMDLAAWLSVRISSPCIANVKEISMANGSFSLNSQMYNGKLIANVNVEAETIVLGVLTGSFPLEAGQGNTAAVKHTSPSALDSARITFLETIRPDNSDVDITTQAKLVSIGRGIGSKDNVDLARDLAKALGAVVSASRPVIDARWLPPSRQVGKSGRKVKPKFYLALGISGSPEHLEGIKGAELVVAINTDKNAPIFNYAHYGAAADLFEVAEAMLELI